MVVDSDMLARSLLKHDVRGLRPWFDLTFGMFRLILTVLNRDYGIVPRMTIPTKDS